MPLWTGPGVGRARSPLSGRAPTVTSALLASAAAVEHGFFGRGDGDRMAGVFTNRQVHGCRVRRVGGGDDPAQFFAGDALVTVAAGVALGVRGADCAPLLLADPGARVVGAAHAGWRGALAGITDATVAAMTRLGARPANIVCAIGPAIQADSYRVGADWARRFVAASPVECADCFRHGDGDGGGDHGGGDRGDGDRDSDSGDGAGVGDSDSGDTGARYFDLPKYIRRRLARAGVTAIDILPHDTVTDARFFSHRRAAGAPCGRQLSVIALR